MKTEIKTYLHGQGLGWNSGTWGVSLMIENEHWQPGSVGPQWLEKERSSGWPSEESALKFANEHWGNHPIKGKSAAAVALGSIKSDKKAASSAANGAKGGRPKKKQE